MGFVLKHEPFSGLIAVCCPTMTWQADGEKANQMEKDHIAKSKYKVCAFDLVDHPRTVSFEILMVRPDSQPFPVLRATIVFPGVSMFPDMVESAMRMTWERIKDLSPMGVKDQAINMTYPTHMLTNAAGLTRQIKRDLKHTTDLLRGILDEGFRF